MQSMVVFAKIYSVIKMDLPKRKIIRLQNYDYSSSGAYFITICTGDHKTIFTHSVGAIHESPEIELNNYGKIVDGYINQLNSRFGISIDKYVIMPDHIHLLVTILPLAGGRPMGAPTVSNILNQLKGYVTKRIGFPVWQKLYYDHIIRDDTDYDAKWQYIDNNPSSWFEKTKS